MLSETDDRCVYEFIKQVDPLHALMKTEAYTVLTQELLTKSVRKEIPSHVTTTSQVYRFLIEKYGGIQQTLEKWVTQLEHAAQSRHRGNRARLEAVEAASMFVDRFMSLSYSS